MAKRAGRVARRYAQAFLSASRREFGAGREAEIHAFAQTMKQFADEFRTNSELQQALLSPMFDRGERAQALRSIAQSIGFSDLGVRMLDVLFERDRLSFASQILESFLELASQAAKIVAVEMTTARELPADERTQVESALARCIDGTPVFQWIVEPTILGGMIVRYDGKVVDGSVSGKLDRIEYELLR